MFSKKKQGPQGTQKLSSLGGKTIYKERPEQKYG